MQTRLSVRDWTMGKQRRDDFGDKTLKAPEEERN